MKIIILENNLRERLGHFLNATIGLARDANRHLLVEGFEVYAHRAVTPEIQRLTNCQPLFRDTSLRRLPFLGRKASYENAGRRFAADCRRIRGIREQDILIVPSAQQNQVRGLELYLGSLPRVERPRVVMNFHVDNFSADSELQGPVRLSFERLQELCGNKVAVTTSTDGMTRRLRRVCGDVTAWTYPLPQNYRLTVSDPTKSRRSTGPVIAALGRPLKRKGSENVAPLLRALHSIVPGCRFNIQTSMGTRGWLGQLLSPGMNVSFGGLSPVDYGRVLDASDIVLFPYHRDIYRDRTSGIFADTAAFGKIAVVPDRTWMARQIEDGKAAGTIFDEYNIKSMLRATMSAIQHQYELHKLATERREYWFREQSTEAYINRLISDFYPISKIPTFRLVNLPAENDADFASEPREASAT